MRLVKLGQVILFEFASTCKVRSDLFQFTRSKISSAKWLSTTRLQYLRLIRSGCSPRFISLSKHHFSSEIDLPLCWKCRIQLERAYTMTCPNCASLQLPPEKINLFSVFNLVPSFNVNMTELAARFKEMQMVTHPDKFSMKPKEEVSNAEAHSSLINKAYTTLRSPWSRGVYLLECKGIQFSESTTIDNPQLLLSIMEKNEEVEDTKDMNKILTIEKTINDDISESVSIISKAFDDNDLGQAKSELVKLKYFLNIVEKIKEKKLISVSGQ